MRLASFQRMAAVVFSGLMASSLLVLADDDETPLGEQMSEISSSLKGLRKAESWEAKAELAREAQKACIASLEYLPKIFADISDEKEKAKATADYKRLIADSLSALCQLEVAFLAEDQDAVDEAMSLIKGVKKEGHKKYED